MGSFSFFGTVVCKMNFTFLLKFDLTYKNVGFCENTL